MIFKIDTDKKTLQKWNEEKQEWEKKEKEND